MSYVLLQFPFIASNGTFNEVIKDFIKQGKNEKVKAYIKEINPSQLVDSSDTSLLHLAVKYKNYNLTKYLIEINCNVNAKNVYSWTPLMMAAMFNNFDVAQLLIENGADIYEKNLLNKSALQLLLSNEKIPQNLIICCLEKLVNDSSNDQELAEKLFTAKCPLNVVIYLKNSNVTRVIIDSHGKIDPEQSCTAIDVAVKLKDLRNVEVLLQYGAKVDISKREAVSFVNELCTRKGEDETSLSIVSAFLKNVKNWSDLREEGLDLLGSLFQKGSKKILELFLQENINTYVKNKFPQQDLLINVFGNYNLDTTELVKDLKFDVNSRGKDGFTALHFAVSRGALHDVKTLIDLGANPNIKDRFGRVPLSCVRSFSNSLSHVEIDLDSTERQIIELLLLAGADPQLDSSLCYENLYYSFSSVKLHLITAQLAIDESQNKKITKTTIYNIATHPQIHNAYKTCTQQLEELKTIIVRGSITLYTILVTDATNIADSIRNREDFEATCKHIDKFHFYYVSKLKSSINHVLKNIDLKMKASTFICEIAGWPNSQSIILEKIISFLSFKDLLVFD